VQFPRTTALPERSPFSQVVVPSGGHYVLSLPSLRTFRHLELHRLTLLKALETSSLDNIAAVMNSMGHSDVKTAMRYQHPELNAVRDAINSRHILRHTTETVN